jgi:hypothetical protein
MPSALTVEKTRELVSAVCEEMEVIVVDDATGEPTGERFSLDCQTMTLADYTELARRLSTLLIDSQQPELQQINSEIHRECDQQPEG